jgi:hypothetical protein
MKKYSTSILSVLVITIVLAIYPLFKNSITPTTALTKEINIANCLADECLLVDGLTYPVSTLPEEVAQALNEAIIDEYKALSTYTSVITKYGSVRPFSMIKGAEEQHIAQLSALFDKYGLTIPQEASIKSVKVPTTLALSCQLGVDAEIANAALYKDNLLKKVAKYSDISNVFTNLMNASIQKHLVAFDRCKN